jgi:small subunit ribosomal protein S1
MSEPEKRTFPKQEENQESFQDILSQYERSQSESAKQALAGAREGRVIAVTAEAVILDIGLKTEGMLPLTSFTGAPDVPKPGEKIMVSIKGRDPEGYYELTRGKVTRPTDWTALEKCFQEKTTISGTVTGVIKGGLSVDVGVKAFLPASRSGTRDAGEMEKLVGTEIRCRITKLDADEEDVVVDRRVVSEEEVAATRERRYSEIQEGDTVRGTVRSLTDYGAFVDIGGVDALLHVADISLRRVSKPSEVLVAGQEIEARVLKVEPDKRRIAIGLKQMLADPWSSAAVKYKVGERVRGTVTRLADFGAFVELEPGLEGLIHISEMSWARKLKRPSDVVKPGESVEAVILGVSAEERRLSLGLKQTLGDPWAEAKQMLSAGSIVEGPITSLTKFGAFVQVAEGVEGMIHVSEISAEKRITHPQDVLALGQVVKAQVMATDLEKRQLRLSIKQMAPAALDEYLAEHKTGDVVTGRTIEVAGEQAVVELGEGIRAECRIPAKRAGQNTGETQAAGTANLMSLTSMLQARWKSGPPSGVTTGEPLRPGQVGEFRIAKLDATTKKIELELA